ncbi:MAG TPA: hypothetical protein VHN20_14620 [Beijerinckiaceae bacterium]|nr:hypothetical protein [Beijerinckiaceae bacterium]
MESDPLLARADAAIRESERLAEQVRRNLEASDRTLARLGDIFDMLTGDDPRLHPPHRRRDEAIST